MVMAHGDYEPLWLNCCEEYVAHRGNVVLCGEVEHDANIGDVGCGKDDVFGCDAEPALDAEVPDVLAKPRVGFGLEHCGEGCCLRLRA